MINIFISRVFRAIKIDIELYEEVEKDKNATIQAGANKKLEDPSCSAPTPAAKLEKTTTVPA